MNSSAAVCVTDGNANSSGNVWQADIELYCQIKKEISIIQIKFIHNHESDFVLQLVIL